MLVIICVPSGVPGFPYTLPVTVLPAVHFQFSRVGIVTEPVRCSAGELARRCGAGELARRCGAGDVALRGGMFPSEMLLFVVNSRGFKYRYR